MEVETVAEHGTTEDGSAACCKRVNQDSLIDCAACLEEEWGALYGSIGGKDRDQFQLILDAVTGSGAKGITKRDLLVGPPHSGSFFDANGNYDRQKRDYQTTRSVPLSRV
jgi:hypothetical protein